MATPYLQHAVFKRLFMTRFTTTCLALGMLATAAAAKPPLREVREIDDMVMVIAIADEIRKSCDDIGARLIRAYATLNGLKSLAHEKGYSEDEVEDYVTSKDASKLQSGLRRYHSGRIGIFRFLFGQASGLFWAAALERSDVSR